MEQWNEIMATRQRLGGNMQIGTLVKAKRHCPANIGLSFPKCFGIVTKVHHTGNIAYIHWLDNLHNGERPIHFCYLEVVCK